MPIDRYLYMSDFWPQQDGSLRLRDGYAKFASGVQPNVQVHSIQGVVGAGPAYKRLIVYWQNKVPYTLDPATGISSIPQIRGAAIQSNDRFCYFYTNGHLHAFNGTDAKFFDGAIWRDIGLPQLDKTLAAAFIITPSVREFSPTEASAVTLTLAGGGSFPKDQFGRAFYCAFYDLDAQEIGPATIASGPADGFVLFALNQELQVAALPNTSSTKPRWVKLPALTGDGDDNARFMVTLTSLLTGSSFVSQAATLAIASASGNPVKFPAPSFMGQLSAPNLAAGPVSLTITGAEQSVQDPTVPASTAINFTGADRFKIKVIGGVQFFTYDTGNINVSINGSNDFRFAWAYLYGQTSDPDGNGNSPIAAALAAAINADSRKLLTASASGITVTITPTVAGQNATYSITSSSVTNQPQTFGINTTSYHVNVSVTPFGVRFIYDAGTVTLTINGVALSVPYGQADTPQSIAAAMNLAVNAQNGILNSANSGAVDTLSLDGNEVLLQINDPAHGLSANDVIGFGGTGDAALDGKLFTVLNPTTNSFQIIASGLSSPVVSGTVYKLLSVTAPTTTVTITSPNSFAGYRVNANLGIPGSTIGGDTPGFQFYGSIYNTNTKHVGNRVPLGARLNLTVRANVKIINQVLSLSDSEWVILIGRTADGAQIPYAIIDADGNWTTMPADGSEPILFLSDRTDIDGDSELPSRNYPPPGTLDFNSQIAPDPAVIGTFRKAWVEADHCCGAMDGQPTVFRSGSALDMREGKFVGLPEQSWDPEDIETLPTASPITCGQGYQQESWVYSTEDVAVLIELAGELGWQGPWNMGAVGQFAWARGWRNLPYWLTGEKQLATIVGSGYSQLAGVTSVEEPGPLPISDEYEAALLSQIADKYLSEVEINYIKIPKKRVEVLRIQGRDDSGNPIIIIHDFNLRDERSAYGIGYQEKYLGPLAGTQAIVIPNMGLQRTGGQVTSSIAYNIAAGDVVPSVFAGQDVEIDSSADPTFSGTFQLSQVNVAPSPLNPNLVILSIAYLQVGIDAFASGNATFLPNPLTFAVARDQNNVLRVLVGAQDGNIYELYSGTNDLGAYQKAQALKLVNSGSQRSATKYLEWYGDPNAKFFVARDLTIGFDSANMQALCDETKSPDEFQGDENNQHWITDVGQDPEMIHLYLLAELQGQDGQTYDLNNPPHIPMESAGRIWLVSPELGATRPR